MNTNTSANRANPRHDRRPRTHLRRHERQAVGRHPQRRWWPPPGEAERRARRSVPFGPASRGGVASRTASTGAWW